MNKNLIKTIILCVVFSLAKNTYSQEMTKSETIEKLNELVKSDGNKYFNYLSLDSTTLVVDYIPVTCQFKNFGHKVFTYKKSYDENIYLVYPIGESDSGSCSSIRIETEESAIKLKETLNYLTKFAKNKTISD